MGRSKKINNNFYGGFYDEEKQNSLLLLQNRADFQKKDAEKALNATLDTIVKAVAENDKIQLTGFVNI